MEGGGEVFIRLNISITATSTLYIIQEVFLYENYFADV